MPLQSMTGFARQEGHTGSFSWAWEVRSVNAKGLDLRFRAPYGFEALDPIVRSTLQKTFKRGNFSINLSVRTESAAQNYQINRAFLDQVIEMLPELKGRVPDAIPPSLDGLLSLKGVIETSEETEDEEAHKAALAAMEADFIAVLKGLRTAREDEGRRLGEVITDQVAQVGQLAEEAQAVAKAHPDMLRAKLRDQVAQLIEDHGSLNEDRLYQEAAVAMTKADVREELDRLRAHVAAAGDLLVANGPVGRKFDFLCQEFNREANTLCSKSPDPDLTRIGLDLKATIDQMREQVQNIE